MRNQKNNLLCPACKHTATHHHSERKQYGRSCSAKVGEFGVGRCGCGLSFEEIVKHNEQPSIRCPKCDMVSYHPKDVEMRYCGNCSKYHVDLAATIQQLERWGWELRLERVVEHLRITKAELGLLLQNQVIAVPAGAALAALRSDVAHSVLTLPLSSSALEEVRHLLASASQES